MKILVIDEIDSTQNEAKRLIDKGSQEYNVIRALSQTHGRGTWGKSWASPKGAGLYVSLMRKKTENLKFSYETYTQEITISIIKAIQEFFVEESLDIFLKPINDIYAKKDNTTYKLAGILVEEYHKHLIIGIGINLYPSSYLVKEELPSLPKAAPISLSELMQNPSKLNEDELLNAILKELC